MIRMNNRYINKKKFAWLLVLLWMGCIFYLSHQSGSASSQLSSGLMNNLIHVFTSIFPIQFHIDHLHFFIRKGAHFFAYFILGLLVINALFKSHNWKTDFAIALSICTVYAITDEIHQLFIPGRSGEIRDVLIDSCGATFGIGLYLIGRKIFFKRKNTE